MLDYKFEKNATYLVAGTYGPDSMALIDMLAHEEGRIIVCAVNYHKFAESNADFSSLQFYCEAKNIEFRGLDTDSLPAEKKYVEGSDFKDWARDIRYSFFKEIYIKEKASALFLAHQQDDLIETYLLQKQRKAHVAHYGLAAISTVDDMIVVRPLLNFSRQDLLDYNAEHRVPYSASDATFQDQYIRNPIRRDVISKLSEIDRDNILNEMRAANDETIGLVKNLTSKIEEGEELDIRGLIALPRDEFASTLVKFVSKTDSAVNLKAEDIAGIRKMCLAPQPNLTYKLSPTTFVIKEYDVITIGHDPDELPYCLTLDKPGVLDIDAFYLDFTMGAEDRNIHEDDYPLTIRSVLPADTYVVHGFLEPVRRLYSVWKMPLALRSIWPVFLNKDGKIIYVPTFRADFREYHTSILRIKFAEKK